MPPPLLHFDLGKNRTDFFIQQVALFGRAEVNYLNCIFCYYLRNPD
jgi:hypothetical protein